MTFTPACPVSPGTHIRLSFRSGSPWGSGVFRRCQERGPQPKAHTVRDISGLKLAMEGREDIELAEESQSGKLTHQTEACRTCSKSFASRPLFSGFEVSVLGIERPPQTLWHPSFSFTLPHPVFVPHHFKLSLIEVSRFSMISLQSSWSLRSGSFIFPWRHPAGSQTAPRAVLA